MKVSELITKLQGFEATADVRYTGTDMSWSADFAQIFQVYDGTDAVVLFATEDVMQFGAIEPAPDVPDVQVDEGWIDEAEDLGEL